MSATPQNSTTKLSKIFRTNNTQRGHCPPRIEKIVSRKQAKGEIVGIYLVKLNLDHI